MDRKKILVIDDEKSACVLIRLNLEDTKEFDVIAVHSGEDGLKRINEEKFDLVILDYMMPGMKGVEVLDKIKQTKPELPVLLCSIYFDDPDAITQASRNKANGVIDKPYTFETLYKAIKTALDK